VINLVTAVSREVNILRIHKSIALSASRSTLGVRWILVVDSPQAVSPEMKDFFKRWSFEVRVIVHTGGRCPYGINQKNEGMGSIGDGYYHCMDDDNIVHPDFFSGLERAMLENPDKKAFVFGQKRWDYIKSLTADPATMAYGKIDNSMFVVHSSLIGDRRYDISKSGSEDFFFFKNLYDLHRDKFVFLQETLAYYNFIKYFPAVTQEELQPVPAKLVKLPPAPSYALTEAVRSSDVLRIALYSAKRDRCGISTYTEHLSEALALLGHDVRYFNCLPPYERTLEEILKWKPDVVHVQHETSIVPPDEILENYLGRIKAQGARIVFTLHTATKAAALLATRIGAPHKSVVTHRPSSDAKGSVVIPMPCTNFGVTLGRSELREIFSFPQDAFVVSTVGFMIPWKSHAEIAEALATWLERDPKVHLQIIASEHFNESLRGHAEECRVRLERLAVKFGKSRVRHIVGYPSDKELIQRLSMSDLGYVWCPFDTDSSSAAAAQFVTAKCPLVASNSTHYDSMGDGVLRAEKTDVNGFAKLIEKTACDRELMAKLKAGQWATYKNRNYIMTAMRHIELYEKGNP
jgi:glycosyltransferase involved in cell wall biosynthesis